MSRSLRSTIPTIAFVLCAHASASAQPVRLVKVISKPVARTTELPGEFFPFFSVELHAKVTGYVEKVLVDRGSVVKEGQLLVQLSAPEMQARVSQAEAQVIAAESEQAQATAQLFAAESSYEKLQDAAKTPGTVAENDLIQAKQQQNAAQALVQSRQRTVESLKSNLKSQQDLVAYLRVTAPFGGVITTRYAHPGALAGPGSDAALLQLDQVSRLRLAVAVPEAELEGVAKGVKVDFTVPAHPNRTFSGTIARQAHALDMKTRTMPVELDVRNTDGLLAPGMYPSVLWPVERAKPSLLVPATSLVTTTERLFVIRDDDGRAKWVDVRKGATVGNLIEVDGNLKAGDEIVEHATDEIREGTQIREGRH